MSKTLTYHYIAFIDILGFSAMVHADCNGPSDSVTFLPRLLQLHNAVADDSADTQGFSVTQFSDSIVLSHPLSRDSFPRFVTWVGKFQYLLFLQGVLCRGGLSYGKHYQHESFLFSEALIKAYRIESEQAIFPRIVIDEDLLDLLQPTSGVPSNAIVREADGAHFVHYLVFGNETVDLKAVHSLTSGWESKPMRVREKLRWLRDYCSFSYPQAARFRGERFECSISPTGSVNDFV